MLHRYWQHFKYFAECRKLEKKTKIIITFGEIPFETFNFRTKLLLQSS
jgi:hypothetical protein